MKKHLEAMRTSSRLTQVFRRMYQPAATMITPEQVIKVLNRAGVKFVLMGGYSISGWRSEPQATHDVDILLAKKYHRKAVRVIQESFTDLIVEVFSGVTRFNDPKTGKGVIDLMKPVEKVYRSVFRNTMLVGKTYAIPNLEMALVAKYAVMKSPHRPMAKKYLDAGNFIDVVENNYQVVDFKKLRRLGELTHRGGGTEIVQYVEDAKAGRFRL